MEFLTVLLSFLQQGDVGAWIVAIGAVVGGLAQVAALTPTPKDDNILRKIKKMLDMISGNWGKARNAED